LKAAAGEAWAKVIQQSKRDHFNMA
jgi:hypothetical protein